MKTVRRIGLMALLPTLALVLGACATVTETFTDVGEPIDTPAVSASPSASAAAETDGTLTIVDLGGPIDGPAVSLTDALENPSGEPQIIGGILLKDLDGVIWLCEELADTSPPSCGEPRLRVLEYPEGGAEWDPELGQAVGLQEEDGVFWLEDTRSYGVIEP